MPDVSAPRPPAPAPAVSRSLKAHTTLRLGGNAGAVVAAAEMDEVLSTVRSAAAGGEPLLVLAGGSNVVIGDAGFAGTVVLLRTRGVRVVATDGAAVTVRVAAGEPWDGVVSWAVSEGLSGIECLAGIPGSAGATPIQNVGAYGQEVADTIVAVHVYDRRDDVVRTMAPERCGFAYRSSVFKNDDRWVVLEVDFRLRADAGSTPVRYAELARSLGVAVGDRVPLERATETVRALRAGKGMVLDAADHDTWSVGSFFTNPVLAAEEFAGLAARCAAVGPPPSWPAPDGTVKVSAAWLIERAGFGKGYRPRGRHDAGVAISGKHTLALTNRGDGSTAALLALAREIRDGVRDGFGVLLHPEPVLVGCEF